MSTKLIASLCPYCAVGCGLYLEVDKGIAKVIEYMTDHPACEGALCPKGNALLEILNHEERLKYPLKKVGDGFVRVTWDEALDLVAQGLSRNLRKHGPKSLGFLASSRCNNEENYLMQKMARLLGSPNVDNCARLCHSPTVVGLGATFGAGAMTNNLLDLENSKCIFAIGTNFTEAHPIVSRWAQKAKDKGAKVIVADPRITSTSWMADIHLRLNPGSDIDLLRGMMKVILDEGLADLEFINSRTVGFEDLQESLSDYSLQEAAEKTGITVGEIVNAARFMQSRPHPLYSIPWASPSTSAEQITSRPVPLWRSSAARSGGREQESGPCAARTMCKGTAIWAVCRSFIPATRDLEILRQSSSSKPAGV